jgi:tight adherence protein B
MRERAYLRRQIRTLSAEGRLSSYILIALPIAMLGYLLLARRDYVRPLYTEPVGLVMSAAATLCLLIGVVVMHKMVKVDV